MFTPYQDRLVAISSFRPLDASAEVAANQIRAKQSWDQAFTRIILFGDYDERLASPTTTFIPADQFPSIALMALTASWQDEPAVILNADIVVSPGLKDLVNYGWRAQALALTSKRAEFDPAAPNYDTAKVVDMGVDFFCAFPAVWQQVYKAIPPVYRIGNGSWDNWMLGFLTIRLPRRFWDISSLRPIFHPRHGERIRIPLGPAPADQFITSGHGFPPALT